MINLLSATGFTSAVLIADTYNANDGSVDAISLMTKVNGVAASACLELQSTLGAILYPRMTTIQKLALEAINGMMVYDLTLNQFYLYQAGAWIPIGTAVAPTTPTVIGDIAIFSNTTGNGLADSGINISLQPPPLTTTLTDPADIPDMSNLGILNFAGPVGFISVGGSPIMAIQHDPITGFNSTILADSSSTQPIPTNESALLELNSTQGTLLFPRMTTVQIGALTPVDGMMLYDTDINHFLIHQGGNWVNVGTGSGSGSVTSIGTGTGLTGGPITISGTISIANTAVTAGTYNFATLTVNAQGQLTAASTGVPVTSIIAGTGLSGGTITSTGTISITNTAVTPGTYNFATLTVNAQGQLTAASTGVPVTSITAGTGLSGGTITSTGTISITNTAVTAGSYTNASLTVNAQGQLTAASSGTAPVTSVSGTAGNITSSGGTTPIINLATTAVTAASYTNTSLTVDSFGRITSASNGTAPVLTVSGTANQIATTGTTAITVSLASNPIIPGTASLTLPTGGTALRPGTPVDGMIRYNSDTGFCEVYIGTSWVNLDTAGGTVTSVGATTTSTGLSITGSPITTTGSFTFTLNSSLQGLAGLAGTGIIVETGSGTYANRSIVSGGSGNLTFSNGDGVSGNPTIDLNSSISGLTAVTATTLTGGNISISGNTIADAAAALTISSGAGDIILSPDSGGRVDINNGVSAGGIRLYNAAGTHYVGFRAPGLTTNTEWVLPTGDGAASTFLQTNGSANLTFASAVTSVAAGSNLTGGTITTTGTIALSTTPSGLTSIGVGNFSIAANTISTSTGNIVLAPNGTSIVTTNSVTSIGTASPNSNTLFEVSATTSYNTLLTGTQTAQTSNNEFCLWLTPTLAPAAAISGYVAGIANTPTITIPNVTNPAIVSGIGIYTSLTINGTAAKVMTSSYGMFVDAGSLTTATVTNAYGGYFKNPGFGTTATALYADNLSIGYTADAPPTNGIQVLGQSGFGTNAPTATNYFEIKSPSASGYATALMIDGTTSSTATFTGANQTVQFCSTGTNVCAASTTIAAAAQLAVYNRVDISAAAAVVTLAAGIIVGVGAKSTVGSGSSITSAYGIFVSAPTIGTTNNAGIYSDNMAIGYQATTPPSSGLIVQGNVGIGVSSSSNALTVVGTSVLANLQHTTNTISATNTNGNIILAPNGSGAVELNNGTAAVPLQFYNSAGTQFVAFKAGTLSGNTTWTLPTTDGGAGDALVTSGTGTLSWSASGVGTVTSITAGSNLTGGTITTTGTIALSTTPSGLTSIGVGNLSLSANTLSSTNTNGNIVLAPNSSGAVTLNNGTNAVPLEFYNSAGTFFSGLKAGAVTSSTTWTLPLVDGAASTFLQTNGSAALTFATAVTSIVAGSNLTGGTITTTGTIALSATPSGLTSIGVGNIAITGNTISSTNTNGNIILAPNGTGIVTTTNVTSIGTSSPNANTLFEVSATTAYNTLYTGTQTAQIATNQICLYVSPTLAPSAQITNFVAAIYSAPTITVPNVTNPAIANAAGMYTNLTVNGTAGKVLTNAYGVYVDSGSLTTATVSLAYGGYFNNPGFGTTPIALYSDNLSIGYMSATPPTNGAVIKGIVGIGTASISGVQLTVSTALAQGALFTAAVSTLSGNNAFVTINPTYNVSNNSKTYGLEITPTYTMSANALGGLYGQYVNLTTGGTSFALSNSYGVYVDVGATSGGSTTISSYGGYFNTPVSGTTSAVALYSTNLAVGYTAVTPPASGAIISGVLGVGTSAPSASTQATISSTLGQQALFTGAYSSALSASLRSVQITSAYTTSSGTFSVYGLSVTPTYSLTGSATAFYGEYINLSMAGTSQVLTSSYGLYVDTGQIALGGTTVEFAYGGYFKGPVSGTAVSQALYADNASIGYSGASPPANGLIVLGNVGINNGSPGTTLDVSGNARVTGFIKTSEAIIAAGALSTTEDSIINASNGAITVTLAAASFIDQIKTVKLISRNSPTVTVTCPIGSFDLTAGSPTRTLRYSNTVNSNPMWLCESDFSHNSPDSFYCTTQAAGPLIGTGNTGAAQQGSAVALSADGNVMVVGASANNSSVGAIWVWNRSGGSWTQAAGPLIGTGGVGAQLQGWSVAISQSSLNSSGNVNTIAVGGKGNSSGVGGVWVWTGQGTSYTQQQFISGTTATGATAETFGWSVALSADGNTMAIGAPLTNNGNGANSGAIWVYTRSGSTWTQQAFLGNSASGGQNGVGVALSADGNVLVGGASGASGIYIYNRVGTTWTSEVGSVPPGAGGSAVGSSVCISADGSTIATGGPAYNNGANIGAFWTWDLGASASQNAIPIWNLTATQIGGTGYTGTPQQGSYNSLSMSGDGNSIAIGGFNNNTAQGAVWVFTRPPSNGNIPGAWVQKAGPLVGTGNTGAAQQGFSVALNSYGNTLAVGGNTNNSSQGAVWVFK